MTRTDPDSFEAMARAALDALPAPFAEHTRDVLLRVVDWPDQEMLDDLGLEDALDLTGLYDGIPLTEKSVLDPAPFPDTVWLFREPILDEWRARGNVSLEEIIAHIVVHEIAHHFGWSDERIAEIDQWWL